MIYFLNKRRVINKINIFLFDSQVKNLILYVLNKNKFKKVNPFHKECIIIEENKLPEAILVIPSPIPRTNSGGISPKLK